MPCGNKLDVTEASSVKKIGSYMKDSCGKNAVCTNWSFSEHEIAVTLATCQNSSYDAGELV